MKTYYVYILANQKNGTLYIGVTNNLIRRIYEHKMGRYCGFTKKYAVKRLVWYKEANCVESALNFEKKLKIWKRKWKLELISRANPRWKDIFYTYSKEWIPG